MDKTCTGCGETKPQAEYYKNKQCRGGYDTRCKTCRYLQQKGRVRTDADRARHRAWYQENREAILAKRKVYKREYRETHRGTPEYRAQRRAERIRRKRLLANAKQEPYTSESIYERDGWVCGLCSGPVDPDLRVPEAGAATIDHVLPLSRGGDDTPANVQTAHFMCNSMKQNRVDEASTDAPALVVW